jgi:3-oxoacyl-[acyl-carrier protein] reductase
MTISPWQGQVALITGCGSKDGIGFAVAQRLGQQGVKLLIAATSERIHQRVSELQADGYEAAGYIADLTHEAEVQGLYDWAVGQWGRVDILVNNAGMTMVGDPEPFAMIADMDLSIWHKSLDRNLTTAFLVTRAVLKTMQKQGYGRIVNVSSTTGTRGTNMGEATYAAAKAGMVGFTMSLALESARQGITANSVAPGWIETASSTDEEREAARYTPMGRAGTPAEVAAAIAFLASPESSYISGELLVVDGANCLIENKAPNA